MSDITKCTNRECPLVKDCYRVWAKDGMMQSYAKFEYAVEVSHEDFPFEDTTYSCEFFYPMPIND